MQLLIIGSLLGVLTLVSVQAQPVTVETENAEIMMAGMSEVQEKFLAKESAKNCTAKRDPFDVRRCWPLPPVFRPDPNIKYLTGVSPYVPWKWWWLLRWIKYNAHWNEKARSILRRLPRSLWYDGEFTREDDLRLAAQNLEVPGQIMPDYREFHWQWACPYKRYYLAKFYHRRFGRCYIIKPFTKQKTPYVRCRTWNCRFRCKHYNPRVRNAICRQCNYRYFTRWVFCPRMFPCPPWFGVFPLTFKVPQCCCCVQCWYMGFTRYLKDSNVSDADKIAMVSRVAEVDADDNDDATNDWMPSSEEAPPEPTEAPPP